MKKYYINVEEGIHYIGQKPGFYQQFEHVGNCIVDKVITGCGATTEALADNVPTILASPRSALLGCKEESDQFKGKVYLFRNEEDTYNGAKAIDLINRMKEYVRSTPVPKILVTYDSFPKVAYGLREMNAFHDFRIIVDEAQALFGDAAFKPNVEIQFLEEVSKSNRAIFISATPYIEDLLDISTYFQNLPYYQLVWPASALQPTNILPKEYGSKTVVETVSSIIQRYLNQPFRYFESKIINGEIFYAEEAVFFLNQISDIISIIRSNGLTPDNTNIICGDNAKNSSKLAAITDSAKRKLGFSIGKAPKYGEIHKPFTFVTKCSFEGTDFYSPNAYTYIFSDVATTNMTLDISLDLRQIMGRQRREDNVFRYDATFYYRPDPKLKAMTIQELNTSITTKEAITTKWIDYYNSQADDPRMVEMLRSDKLKAQKQNLNENEYIYSHDYVSFVENTKGGPAYPVENELAKLNEIRAWQIQQTQYLSSYQILRAIEEVTVHDIDYPLIDDFKQKFTGGFRDMMKTYCDILSMYPEYKCKLESLPQIPLEIKQYYDALEPEVIKRCKYSKSAIMKQLHMDTLFDDIQEAVRGSFAVGKKYTLQEVKAIIQNIYDHFGKTDEKASAKDIEKYMPGDIAETQFTLDGKRVKGYRIL